MNCQLTGLSEMRSPNGLIDNLMQARIKTIWKTKKKLKSMLSKALSSVSSYKEKENKIFVTIKELKQNDMVKVKSKKEIKNIINSFDSTGGCVFAPEMYAFCGKTLRVHKNVVNFYDEVKEKKCKCKNIVLLEGVYCSGRRKAMPQDCDRNCFYFWHYNWLEKIS